MYGMCCRHPQHEIGDFGFGVICRNCGSTWSDIEYDGLAAEVHSQQREREYFECGLDELYGERYTDWDTYIRIHRSAISEGGCEPYVPHG